MPGLRDERRLTSEQVTAPVADDWLPFETTDDIPALEAVFGQERAVRAIEFALGMQAKGYNLYASGPDGFGKSTIVEMFLRRRAAAAEAPLDWVYVHNFHDPDKPAAISLPPGTAHSFAQEVRHAVQAAARDINAVFESDDYARQRQAIADQLDAMRAQVLEALQEQARQVNFALQAGAAGISTAPLINSEPATEESFNALSDEEKAKIAESRRTLEKTIQEGLLSLRAGERQAMEVAEQLDAKTAAFAVNHLFDHLQERYGNDQEIREFLEAIRDDLAENHTSMREDQQPANPMAQLARISAARRYEVNVYVSNDPQRGAPVVVERNPTYYNLIGRIEYEGNMGVSITDHTLIRAGALAHANGGYLVVRLRELLNTPAALEGLKRALMAGLITVENLSENFQLVPTTALRPEPIPLAVKVVLVGESVLYGLLYRYDPDFRELFRVKADFETEFVRTRESASGLASIIRAECDRGELLDFTRAAVCRLVEHSSRMVDDRRRLSANMGAFLDVVRQADHWARQDGAETVHERHILKALDERIYRSSLIADRIQSSMSDGTIHVETEGGRIGQINALSVFDLGDMMFGSPSRVTCVTSAGRGTIVMVERESEMAGRIHNKGFLILRGFLAHKFGQDRASSLHASLTFEQLYSDIDGDSASSTELYALLSSLAEVPIDQSVAVTGSVDQLGRVQPIGGANAKIEGFFDICRARGLTGKQGVMIPRTNIENVILRHEVAEAIAAGQFHVWAIDSIEDGIELLTGIPAGRERNAEGRYPEGTIFRLVEDRLAEFASSLERRPATTGADGHVPIPHQGPYPTPPGIPPRLPPEPPVIV